MNTTRCGLRCSTCWLVLCGVIIGASGCLSRTPSTLKDSRISITPLSDHDVSWTAFRLPKGAFKGWECEFANDHAFKLWLIDPWTENDVYLYIPVTNDMLTFNKEVWYPDWKFDTVDDTSAETTTCTASNESEKISVKIQLPYENGKRYGIAILKSSSGAFLMVFGNGSDYAKHDRDRGIFGYVIVKPKKSEGDQARGK
jgi:hypothetical protein